MNEPKQITTKEINNIFKKGFAPYNKITYDTFIKLAKSKNWIKPDPTLEEEFSEWLNNEVFIDDVPAEDLAIIESKALEAMAKIREEYEDA
jgi:hypothetical protein